MAELSWSKEKIRHTAGRCLAALSIMEKSLEIAAVREAKEETCLDVTLIEQFSYLLRSPKGSATSHGLNGLLGDCRRSSPGRQTMLKMPKYSSKTSFLIR